MRLFRTTLAAALVVAPSFALASEGHGFVWSEHGLYILDFLILAGILYWFARKPIKAFLEERSRLVAHEILEARKLREAAAARLAEYETRLAALEAERTRILESFVEDGERERDRIIRDAEVATQKMVADAERRITQEARRLEQALEHEAVELAVSMSETIVRERLRPDVQQRMIADYISGLETMDDSHVFANA
jgi:F-type H+-transporting ATPase subunit b